MGDGCASSVVRERDKVDELRVISEMAVRAPSPKQSYC